MRLKETASISTPEARLIVIQPWDPAIIADIERALRDSELGVTPVNDGALIRVVLPEKFLPRAAKSLQKFWEKNWKKRA